MAKRKKPGAGSKPAGDEPFPPAWVELDDPTGLTIRRATEEGRADVISYLLAHGADVDVDTVEDIEDPSALMIAAEAGRADLVHLLLGAGADPARVDRDDEIPLLIAARRGDRAVFDLLAEGIDPARRSSAARVLAARERSARSGSGEALASLLEASRAGRAEAVRAAVAAGANPDARGPDGLSALHQAARIMTGTEAASALIEAGADPNIRDDDGQTPLFFAWTRPMIELLAAFGADPDARNRLGMTALHASAWRGEADRLTWLVAAGARTAARDNEGQTPLHTAASERRDKAFLALVEAGVDLGAVDDQGRTALDLARSSFYRPEHQSAFSRLKKALVRGGHVDGQPDTLLAAVAKGQPKPVQKLLARGTDVNALGDLPGRQGVTPLHVAATAGDPAMIELLLNAGADPRARIVTDLAKDLKRLDGVTAREGAIAHGHTEIAAILERAEAGGGL